jgi:predicted alpha/beta-hydrolase family hydrolase
MPSAPSPLTFPGDPNRPDVDALWLRPRGAKAVYVLAHGAGAGMEHAFMVAMADALAAHGIATLRFMFPYMQAGSRRPDAERILRATLTAAAKLAVQRARGLPVFAGGKSMGGRMTSRAMAEAPMPGIAGLAFLGFPLHPAGKSSDERAAHLSDVSVPMLFVQGTRDRLATLDLLHPVIDGLGDRATLHIVDGGDHSLAVPKRSGRTSDEVLNEVASTMAQWMSGVAS